MSYSGCSDLICALHFVGDMEKMRSTLGYVSKYHSGR